MTEQEMSDAVGRAHDDLYRLISHMENSREWQRRFNRIDNIIAKLRRGLGLQTAKQHDEDRRKRFESGVSA